MRFLFCALFGWYRFWCIVFDILYSQGVLAIENFAALQKYSIPILVHKVCYIDCVNKKQIERGNVYEQV